MNIATHRKVYFWITGIILAAAIGAIITFGLPLDIDFTGGSLTQIRFPAGRPALSDIRNQLSVVPLGTVSIRELGTDSISIRTRTQTPAEHNAVLEVLERGSQTSTRESDFQEMSYTSIGPSFGNQFATKALWAITAVGLAVILYIALAFWKVSRPVPSWGYGLTVIAILVHDLVIPAGFFAVLSHFTGIQVDALFITALLALLGYSVNDTIIIFDRVREHLARNEKTGLKETYETTVGKSISETMTRSINTSLTVVLALLVLAIFGASATRVFSMVMLAGVVAGTYSSILLAAPLLIPLSRRFIK